MMYYDFAILQNNRVLDLKKKLRPKLMIKLNSLPDGVHSDSF